MRDKAPPEEIREWLAYYPESGCFMWLKPRGPAKAGSFAGYLQTNNDKSHVYIALKFNRVEYSCHRLAWWFMTGEWPEHPVDHAKWGSLDNRWENLRKANASENACNRRRRSDNRAGFKGVRRLKTGKYEARITLRGKAIYLGGTYPSPEAAHQAYVSASQHYHGEFSRAS